MRRRPVALLCLILMVVLSVLALAGCPLSMTPPGTARADRLIAVPRSYLITGTVTESLTRENSSVVTIDRAVLTYQSEDISIPNVKITYQGYRHYEVGNVLSAFGPVERIAGPENPGQFDAELYYRVQGIRYTMFYPELHVLRKDTDPILELLTNLRARAKERICRAFPEDVSGIVCAMLIGDKSGLEDDVKSLWKTGGILHVLAISGLHLTVLGMGLYHLLRKLRLRIQTAAIITSVLMLLYTIFTGASVSAIRAYIMFFMAVFAEVIGRTYDPLTALAVAAILILAENPSYILYSGFQMSCAAVASCGLMRGRGRGVTALSMTLCMLPLVVWNYFELPLYSVLVNLLALPLVPFILGGGILGAVVPAAAFAGIWLIRLLNKMLSLTLRLPASAIVMGRPEGWQIAVYLVMLTVWLYGMWHYRRYKRRLLLYLMVPFMVVTLHKLPIRGAKVIFQSVGQGDSILIETEAGADILVDGGSSSVSNVGTYRILPCVESEGISYLDYVIVTHSDADHMNGVLEILQKIAGRRTPVRIGTLVLPYVKQPDETYSELVSAAEAARVRVLKVAKGDRLAFGRLSLEVMNPDPACEGNELDSNAQCIVLSLSYGTFDALLTGDVSGRGEEQLIRLLDKRKKRYECLKVAHHGSRYSTPDELLEIIRPEISVISCGKDNDYGHPHETLLARLRKYHTNILRTDEEDAIIVEISGNDYMVRRKKS